MHEIRTVGVIGAGIAGLATAKVLKQFGFQVTVFEKESDVGGVWSASRRYPGLTTQNPRTTYEFSDFPMPADYPEWPTGEQMQAYLRSYAEAFELSSYIRLGTRVARVDFDPATEQWLAVTEQVGLPQPPRQSLRVEHRFEFLVVCNGIFSTPWIPDYPGADEFIKAGGRVCHTSAFTNLEEARDRHVIIVGYGKSSCDVANATAAISAATQVVVRGLIWKIPKRIARVLNFKYLFLTRLGEGLFRYIRLRGFERFLHGPGLPLRNSLLKSVESIVAWQLRLRALGLHPGRALETIARSTVSLVTDGFYENVGNGRICVHPRESIVGLRAHQALLSGGKSLRADIVVCGTGWLQQVPFFASEIRHRITDHAGNFRLYRSLIPVDVPRLAFNGYNSSFFSQLNAEVGALWLAAYLRGGVTLPSQAMMNADIDQRLAWMEQRTDGKHSKGTNIIPFSVHQIDELLEDIHLSLSRFLRLRQWFIPVVGAHFRSLTPRLLRRLRKQTQV